MANELTIAASLKFVKGTVNRSFSKAGVQLNVAGKNYTHKTQTIGTVEEAIALGDVVTPGYILVFNSSTLNFVSIRSGTGAANLVKVPPGGVALFSCEAAAPFAIANTAAVDIEYLLIEA